MNTVFIPMGSSSVDLWGADRIPEDHKYATSILALDATTGKESGYTRPCITTSGISISRCSRAG